MPIYDIYSKRRKRWEQAGQPDVYEYDDLPMELRAQVMHIWDDTIAKYTMMSHEMYEYQAYESIEKALARELGLPHLTIHERDPKTHCIAFLKHAECDNALDLIEMSFQMIEDVDIRVNGAPTEQVEAAVSELNIRFKENGVGYQYVDGYIMRMDSQYLHSEVVQPALALLQTSAFENASNEFLEAHEHYRYGKHPEAIAGALKAFESTLKYVCDARGWAYKANDTAKPLINIVLANELVPSYMQTHLNALAQTLESGLPTVRNKEGGHGKGAKQGEVSDYFAGYALHLAATNIVFLTEAYQNLPDSS